MRIKYLIQAVAFTMPGRWARYGLKGLTIIYEW